ncbi:Copper amine oxidase N-terminal domain [Chlamydia abortus]|uniref:Stalk domain-containing protein n=1 Tax=Paenibacillus residui TaxID=629724 RepID=A0ABW3D8K9_9BACL|nr:MULTISPECIES: copper amine oxidase N-terminal domain-containing protein [Paenibacillaceae]SHE10527.1 Copper amine oxidase N-terminal domain [Chlamydia abortus]
MKTKSKRIVILTTLIFTLGTVTAFGESLWGSYEGYSKARVFINDNQINVPQDDVPAFIINGRTVLPLRLLAESLQATVSWDNKTQTAKIYKPNIHMFVSLDVDKDYTIKKPFGKVAHGETRNFVVSTQVDTLKMKPSGFKITIEAPNGELATDAVEVPLEESSESFWYTWPFKVSFTQAGNYTVNFSLLVNGEYTVVSKKTIVSE